jgi:hypothetical protein
MLERLVVEAAGVVAVPEHAPGVDFGVAGLVNPTPCRAEFASSYPPEQKQLLPGSGPAEDVVRPLFTWCMDDL